MRAFALMRTNTRFVLIDCKKFACTVYSRHVPLQTFYSDTPEKLDTDPESIETIRTMEFKDKA